LVRSTSFSCSAQHYSVGMINIIQLLCSASLGRYSSVYLRALLGWSSQHRSVAPLSITRLVCATLLRWFAQHNSVLLSIVLG
jgi:hypothetical protein